MKTKSNNIQTIEDIYRRKVQLRRRMVAQKEEILTLANELQEEITPANLIRSAKNELFKSFETEELAVSREVAQNIANISSYFIKNKRAAFLIKWLGPVAIAISPRVFEWVGDQLPSIPEIKYKIVSFWGRVKSVFQ